MHTQEKACIRDGCGMLFDPTVPEKRDTRLLRPFWQRYCPKHRLADTPPVIVEGIPATPQGRTRKATHARNEIVEGQPIRVYDSGPNSTPDRYTVVFMNRKLYVANPGLYAMLGMSALPFHPQGIGQHSEGKLGKHLGKRIPFAELPEDCRTAVLRDLTPDPATEECSDVVDDKTCLERGKLNPCKHCAKRQKEVR